MVTVDDVRALAETLPRSYEVLVRDRVKFRVGQIVYRRVLPRRADHGLRLPQGGARRPGRRGAGQVPDAAESDLRYNWVVVRLAAIDDDEMRELVLDAWRMVVPKKVARARSATEVAPSA